MTDAPERRQIPLAGATFKELRDFANNDMGIQIVNGWKSKDIREALAANGWEHDYIIAQEAVTSEAVEPQPDPKNIPATPKPVMAAKPGEPKEVPEPMVTISVQQQEGAGGKRPYFVGVNGVGILLPRNKDIRVKLRYVNALESAMQTTFELDEENNEQIEKQLYAVPYMVKVPAKQEDIDAWLAWEAFEEARQRSIDRAHNEKIRQHLRSEEQAA